MRQLVDYLDVLGADAAGLEPLPFVLRPLRFVLRPLPFVLEAGPATGRGAIRSPGRMVGSPGRGSAGRGSRGRTAAAAASVVEIGRVSGTT